MEGFVGLYNIGKQENVKRRSWGNDRERWKCWDY